MIGIKILVLNSGSSSLKYQLIDMIDETVLCKGMVERIGGDTTEFFHRTFKGISFHKYFYNLNSHDEAFKHIKEALLDKKMGVVKDINEISAIGHRVVHGGEYFKKPSLINQDTIDKIESLIPLAPLHNKASLYGIKSCLKLFGNEIPQVAVFDTSYYSSIPPEAYMYPIPYEYYKKYNIRKYGFHGTSHEFVSLIGAKILGKDISKLKIVSCHLGNGSSITAINHGKAIETSMGLTPLGGLMMGTRCGSLDPSVVIEMSKKESLSFDQLSEILHKKSGLKGVSGISNDDREVLLAEELGNKRAKLAHKMMIHQITEFIGGYIAILGGCDALIFTGGIGENQWMHREKICKNFSFMGMKIDDKKNKETVLGKDGIISSTESKIKVIVIPTNEELAIARATINLLGGI